MTVLEASAKLFEWFSEKDSFSIDRDLSSLLPDLDAEKRDEKVACLINALEEFETSDIAKSCDVNDTKYWTLKRDLSGYDQNIQINSEMANSMATIINGFCSMMNVAGEKCDPKSITQNDLANLITVCATMVGEKNNNDDTENGLDLNQFSA